MNRIFGLFFLLFFSCNAQNNKRVFLEKFIGRQRLLALRCTLQEFNEQNMQIPVDATTEVISIGCEYRNCLRGYVHLVERYNPGDKQSFYTVVYGSETEKQACIAVLQFSARQNWVSNL